MQNQNQCEATGEYHPLQIDQYQLTVSVTTNYLLIRYWYFISSDHLAAVHSHHGLWWSLTVCALCVILMNILVPCGSV